MITLEANVWCDAMYYTDKQGDRLEPCLSSFTASVSLDEVKTSLYQAAKNCGWWRDPKAPYYIPKFLCPACRARMLGRS